MHKNPGKQVLAENTCNKTIIRAELVDIAPASGPVGARGVINNKEFMA
jgi:hypothetical protein